MYMDEGLGSNTASDDFIRGWRWVKAPTKIELFAPKQIRPRATRFNLLHDRIDLEGGAQKNKGPGSISRDKNPRGGPATESREEATTTAGQGYCQLAMCVKRGLGVVRVGQRLAVYRQRLVLSFEGLDIGTDRQCVEKMPTFGPGLEPLGKEGGWGDKELQQRREKREEKMGEGINGMHQCVCQPVQLCMYLYLYVSRRAYDKRVGGGDADAMQFNVC